MKRIRLGHSVFEAEEEPEGGETNAWSGVGQTAALARQKLPRVEGSSSTHASSSSLGTTPPPQTARETRETALLAQLSKSTGSASSRSEASAHKTPSSPPLSSTGSTVTAASADAPSSGPQAREEGRVPRRATLPVRTVAGEKWVDKTLADWPKDDYRIFVGDIGPEVTAEMLEQAFSAYPSLQRTRVVRDRGVRFRGYGFVSFAAAEDYLRALREMQGRYIGSRPVKLRKSTWKDREKPS